MMTGFGGFSLPAVSLPFFESSSGSSFLRSTSRSLEESGDHSYCEMLKPLMCVSWRASPPRRSSNHTCEPLAFPGRDETNDRYLPSGLQRGELSDSLS